MSGSQPPNGTQGPRSVPPGAGLQWNDTPRDVFTSPYFATSALGEIFAPAIKAGAIQVVPQIIQPIVNQAADQAVRRLAVMKTGDTMVGRLFSSYLMPAADTEYVTKAYVDMQIGSAMPGLPEVPFFPQNALWVRQYGQWIQYTAPDPNNFLLLAGGTMEGIINMGANSIDNLAPQPVMPNGAAPASWVLTQLASVSLYQGLYDANNNSPDLSSPSLQQNGWTWIAVTDPDDVPVTVTASIPGLVNQTLNNGDTVVYSSRVGQFQIIHGGGLTMAEANALFLPLGGGTMVGPLMLARDPQSSMEAVTMGWVTDKIGQGFPEVPDDGLAYARSYGAWVSIDDLPIWNAYLPLTGGHMTGPIYLSQDAALPNQPVTLSQMQENAASVTIASAPPATPLPGALWWDDTIAQMFIWYDDGTSEQWVQANSMSGGVFLPLTGGTLSGPLTLAGNATQPLQAVTLQQMQSTLTGYLPLTGGTLTGNLRLLQTLFIGTSNDFYLSMQSFGPVLNWAPNWFDLWRPATGAREWYGPTGALMTLNGSGDLRLAGILISNTAVVHGIGITYDYGDAPIYHAQAIFTSSLYPVINGSLSLGAYQLTGSDQRLKENIADCGDALASLQDFRVVSFDRKDDRGHFDFGLIADDLMGSDCVIVPDDPAAMKSIDIMPIAARCIKAIQQLSSRLEALERRH